MPSGIRGASALAVMGAVALLAIGAATPAVAAPGAKAGRWSTFTVDGGTGGLTGATGTLAMAPGFPAATFTTDAPSLAASTGAVIGAATPPGVAYGGSSGGSYLGIRPLATGAMSTTTITFASPTPADHWSLVLGDIDAESVTVTATGPGGPLTAAQLGFDDVFNYAGTAALPVQTTGPDSETFAGAVGATSTDGAAAWLSPTAAISTLTITSTRIAGLAVVQLWLVGHVASLAGLVTDAAGAPVPGATVTVDDPTGAPLPGGSVSTTTDASGAFEFPEIFGTPVGIIATAPDRQSGPRQVVTPTLDSLGDPVFATLLDAEIGPTVTPAADPTPPDPELAATGVADTGWWAVGAALVLGGLALRLVARRRIRGAIG